MNEQHKHLNLEKQAHEMLSVARLQGQWTATKSLMRQAEQLGDEGTKVYQQMKVHLESVKERLPYDPNQS